MSLPILRSRLHLGLQSLSLLLGLLIFFCGHVQAQQVIQAVIGDPNELYLNSPGEFEAYDGYTNTYPVYPSGAWSIVLANTNNPNGATIRDYGSSVQADITQPGDYDLTCSFSFFYGGALNFFYSSLRLHVIRCRSTAPPSQYVDWGSFDRCPEVHQLNLNTLVDCSGDEYNTQTYPGSQAQPSAEQMYKFHLSQPTEVEVSTCASSINTVLHLVQSSNYNTLSPVLVTSSNSGCGSYGYLKQTLQANKDYFLIVEGAGTAEGAIQGTVTFRPLNAPVLSITANNVDVTNGAVDIAPNGSVQLTANMSNGASYTWSPAIGLSSTSSATTTAAPTLTTVYQVSTMACSSYPVTAQVTVRVVLSNRNYITTRIPQDAGRRTEQEVYNQSQEPEDLQTSTQYFDELGRADQTVMRQFSPTFQDLVTPVTYDALGRPNKTYLPYAGGNDGSYKTNALSAQTNFYAASTLNDNIANDAAPWAITEYEASPLSRVVRQGAPGMAWQPDTNPASTSTDHTHKTVMRTNVTGEVRQWEVGSSAKVISSPGFYSAGQLAVTETKDENGHLLIEYKDTEGHTIAKKQQEGTISSNASDAGFIVTQYVYDNLGNLRVVIQPEGTRHVPEPLSIGRLTREYWNGLDGTPDITHIPLGTLPTSVSFVTLFEGPDPNVYDSYGQRLRGYVTAPSTGKYVFWIASDDHGELWLSTTDSPGQKEKIASVDNWTNYRDWGASASQQSRQIQLEAGKRYYIEALQKEGGGGDHLSVGWQRLDATGTQQLALERPIPASYLSTDVVWLDATFLDTYCFRYEYDGRRRMTEKYVPGGGTTFFAYDRRNQLVGTQDQQQSVTANFPWNITKYDALGRPIATALAEIDMNRVDFQSELDALPATALSYESRSTTGVGYSLSQAYPSLTEPVLQTLTFYDDYTYPQLTNLANSGFTSELGLPAPLASGPTNPESQANWLQGQVTGRVERVLTTGTPWLATKIFYNNRLQPIQQLTQHYPNGTSLTSTRTDFLGRAIASQTTQEWSNIKHSVRNDYLYDHVGRVKRITQTMDAGLSTAHPAVIVAANDYNQIGQLVDKKLHSADNGTTYLQSVDYRYNIRGWLSNINNRNLSNNPQDRFNDADANADDLNVVDEDLFGMEIMYNNNHNLGLSPFQFNGNISEVMWKTRNVNTGQKLHGYAYHYDNANRISSADFRTYDYDSNPAVQQYTWDTHGNVDYSVPNVVYDGNGNITRMERKGRVSAPGASQTVYGDLDKLTYNYIGNRLVGVDEDLAGGTFTGLTTAATHDFEDNGSRYSTPNPEYEYDQSGRLKRDANKLLDNISYNYLGLPQSIQLRNNAALGGTPTIEYLYSASGQKLRKTALVNGQVTSRTDYVNGFVYETTPTGRFNKLVTQLSFAPSPEGRVLYIPGTPTTSEPFNWKYEYHLKDHLGNLRFAFRADRNGGVGTQRSAGMEPTNATSEEQQFQHVAETRFADPSHARTGEYVARLNARSGHRDGPSIQIKVAAGDSIRAEAFGRYERNTPIASLVQKGALVAGATVAGVPGQVSSDQTQPVAARKRWLPFIGASIGIVPQLLKANRTALPVAYLRYEMFDKDSQLVATKIQTLRRTASDEWQHLQAGVKADSAGFARVSLINESDVPAYFDDMALSVVAPSPVQENHYDPFGLNLVGIEEADSPNSNFQFNGKEKQADFGLNWTDYGARMYDMQLGRWHVVDPHSESYPAISVYSFAGNNPITFLDIDGKDWFYYRENGQDDPSWHWQKGNTYTVNTTTKDGKAVSQQIQGVEAVVEFSGSRYERLGDGNNIHGEGAVTASVTVYGPGGSNDIHRFRGYTMTSNAVKFGAIDEGSYDGNYDSDGKSGSLKSHWALNHRGRVRMMDGKINPYAPDQIDESTGEGFKDGIFIHSPNSNGFAGEIHGGKSGITVGCLLIDPRDWAAFNSAMSGVKHFKVDVQRQAQVLLQYYTPW